MSALRRSAGTRIAVSAAGIFLLASTTIGLAAIVITQWRLQAGLDRYVERASAPLVSRAAVGRAAVIAAIAARERRTGDQIGYALFDSEQRRVAGSLDIAYPAAGWSNIDIRDPVEGRDPARALATPLRNGDRLVVAGNRRPLISAQSAIGALYLLAVVVTLLLCGIMAIVLSRYLARRLGPISRVATAAIDGGFAQRIPIHAVHDEFDAAAMALNLMLDRVGGLVESVRQVSSDIAHDLRTPLTHARSELEAGLVGHVTADIAMARSLDHLDSALDLFAAILRVTEVEGGHHHPEPFALDLLAADVVASFRPVFEDAGSVVSVRTVADAYVSADRAQVAMLLVNLLENVLRHAGSGAAAVVEVARAGDAIRLTVRDDGPGVPVHERDRIFGRFVRLDPARNDGGFGLGLSMVLAVAQANGAALSVDDSDVGFSVSALFVPLGKAYG